MPSNGNKLSILGYGCMRLPQKDGKIDVERAEGQVRSAIERGVNYIDTAVPYHMGASEPFVGNLLAKDGLRERVFLATKLPHWSMRGPEDGDKILNAQLERLQTDHIDYYLVHNLNRVSWDRIRELGVLDLLQRAKQDGRIVNAGFSYHGDRETFPEIVDGFDWDFCQIQYNFLDKRRQATDEGLRYAASKGLGVVIMEPLRGGLLARNAPERVQEIWDKADVTRTPAEWSLRWIWDHPEVTVVLSGMNDDEHIDENLRMADVAEPGSLTDKERELVDRASKTYQELMRVDCTGCAYCMPCPAGVDIPTNLDVFNLKHTFGAPADMLYMTRVGGILRDPTNASLCTACGLCLTKCPQHLPIPDLLEEVTDEFEGLLFKPKRWLIRRVMDFQRRGLLKASRGGNDSRS